MKRLVLIIRLTTVLSVLVAGGCQSYESPTLPVTPDDRMKAAIRLPEETDPTLPKLVEIKVPVPAPQLRGSAHEQTTAPTLAGLAAVQAAQLAATTQPASNSFLNATQYYDYAPGLVYTAVTSPGYVTTIALRPGEHLITAAAGDTTRWAVESVEAGAGSSAQTLLLVKPRRSQIETNLLITTDQRVYALDLSSTDSGIYHTMIAWNYPFGDLVMMRNEAAEEQVRARETVARGLDLTRANFNYLILRQRHCPMPPWCPIRAFDDGQKTYIQFPPRIAVSEAPPLFVLGRAGDAQLVNYRVKGEWYIVDRLFDRAELRLGQTPQTIIAIQRANAD